MNLKALFAGCWSGHAEPIWTGNVLTCLQCGTVIEVLPQKTVIGPAHVPEPVRGTPLMKAKVQRRDNVADFRQSQR